VGGCGGGTALSSISRSSGMRGADVDLFILPPPGLGRGGVREEGGKWRVEHIARNL